MKRIIGKKWLRLTVMIPLVIVLVVTNVYQDPASLFHDYSLSVSEAILRGEKPYFYSENADERGVKQHLIEGMPKKIECVTIGPSLSLCINSEMVGTDSYYNLSFSELTFADLMAEFAMLEVNNIEVDRVVLSVDTYLFDDGFADRLQKPEWEPYTNYMKKRLDGEDVSDESLEYDPGYVENINRFYDHVGQALSLTYFQASCDLIKQNKHIIQKSRCGIIDDSTKDNAYFNPDASWVYSKGYRQKGIEYVIDEAKSFDIRTQFAYNNHISDEKVRYFDKLIEYLLAKGVEVEFFICPLCPSLWDRLDIGKDDCKFYILNDVENHIRDLSEKYNIKMVGSYNPYEVGVEDDDFWDCRHMKIDRLDYYFDFKG